MDALNGHYNTRAGESKIRRMRAEYPNLEVKGNLEIKRAIHRIQRGRDEEASERAERIGRLLLTMSRTSLFQTARQIYCY